MIFNVIDAPCGYGKTTWAIQNMNEVSKEEAQFIFVTPFLKEIDRIQENVNSRKVFTPEEKNEENKLDDLKKLIKEGKDVAITHNLFKRFDDEIINNFKEHNYVLILDEVLNVIEQIELRKDDLKLLKNANAIEFEEQQDGLMRVLWKEYSYDDTQFNRLMNLLKNKQVISFEDKYLIRTFPPAYFEVFSDVFVLTYLFRGQIFKAYCDLYNIKIRYLSVKSISNEKFELVPYKDRTIHDKTSLQKLINIHESKLNDVGTKMNALSVSWLSNSKYSKKTKQLRNHIYNYLTNKIKEAVVENSMWTTSRGKDDVVYEKLVPKSFKDSYVSVVERATNDYKHKFNLVYAINRYMNPIEKRYFISKGVKIDEDVWALSEMIQWIWRSRIREGKSINIYVPSSRMRKLLETYLKTDVYEEVSENAITNQYSNWSIS